jgi:hypothetical protein
MAIKGKGKTKARKVAKGPRRAPVPVKPPFFTRRPVQVIGAFVLGILAMMFLVWVTNGLREQDRAQRAREREAAKLERTKSVVEAWQVTVEGAAGTIGTITPGAPPALLPAASAAIDGVAGGNDVKGAPGTLSEANKGLSSAISTLDDYQLVDRIRDKGFDVTQTNYLLNSKTKMLEALKIYREAVAVAQRALKGEAGLGDIAIALRDQAVTLFADGWRDLDQAKQSVGINPIPGGLAP